MRSTRSSTVNLNNRRAFSSHNRIKHGKAPPRETRPFGQALDRHGRLGGSPLIHNG